MNIPEMNIKTIEEALFAYYTDNEEYDLFSDDIADRMQLLAERLEELPGMNKELGASYHNDVYDVVCDTSRECFYTGLHIGLNVIRKLMG